MVLGQWIHMLVMKERTRPTVPKAVDCTRPGVDHSQKVLALYRKRSGGVQVVEVAEAAAPERF